MDLFLATFQAIVLIFGVGVVGFLVISRKIVPLKILDVLSPLIIDVSVPALIFTNILSRFDPDRLEGWYTLPLWWIGYTLLIFGLVRLLRRFIPTPEVGMGLLYPNFVFLPLAVIPQIFPSGSTALVELFIFTLFAPAFFFNGARLFYEQRGPFEWRRLLNPISLATLLSIGIVLSGLKPHMPGVLLDVTRMLGALALPLVMILIGGNLYVDFKRRGALRVGLILRFLALRNVVLPALILGLLIALDLSPKIAFLLFLMTIVPPLTAIPIIVERAKGDVPLSNQLVVSSLAASILTVPAWLSAFNRFFELI